MELRQNCLDMNSREIAVEIWAGLPYAVIWTVWKTRNAVIFENDTAVAGKVLQRFKATIWQ
ncbi:hypothetical protein FRX31_033317 [Thalictrum thalictroides]|uniref:Uncharacterized protein n=1 Tax=Thalictrum thalictroides TaxID=46969 RepID=A0A7J6UXD8_THATH|nr:hypothetical protein FRX31_033317 [Thalictrum thalictroides]